MTLILKQFFGFLKLLNSETGTNQLAAGLALGLVLGLSPVLSLQAILLLLICLLFRVQIGAIFVSAFFFKLIAYAFDPVTDALGRSILEAPALRGLFVELYNLPIVPMTRFNNSVIMGSGVLGFILALPMFFVFRHLVIKYRATVVARLRGTKWWKAMQATALFRWYASYEKMTGNLTGGV